MQFPGGQLLLQLWIAQKTPCFVSCYDPLEKRPIFVSTVNRVTASAHAIIMLVLDQDARSTVLGNMRHVQVIRQNVKTSTMASCCSIFIYSLGAVGMHQHSNFLDCEFSSDHSWPIGMLIFQTVFPCAKHLCHLNTELWPKASLPYTYL
jgi:hypothetical protein